MLPPLCIATASRRAGHSLHTGVTWSDLIKPMNWRRRVSVAQGWCLNAESPYNVIPTPGQQQFQARWPVLFKTRFWLTTSPFHYAVFDVLDSWSATLPSGLLSDYYDRHTVSSRYRLPRARYTHPPHCCCIILRCLFNSLHNIVLGISWVPPHFGFPGHTSRNNLPYLHYSTALCLSCCLIIIIISFCKPLWVT